MQPLGKNKILARFENLADKFDVKGNSTNTKYLNVVKFAQAFYNESNSGAQTMPEIHILETSITHNQPQEDLDSRGKIWTTVDDATSLKVNRPADKDALTGIALEP